jgi:molybdopterin/thiamine biosynthesis adenylyltransferase
MLIFQIARLSQDGGTPSDGVYQSQVRLVDDGDCLTTIPRAGNDSENSCNVSLPVRLYSIQQTLTIDEPGAALAMVLAVIAQLNQNESSDPKAFGEKAGNSPWLVLLRFRFDTVHSVPTLWILQREFRRHDIDICFDKSDVLVGYSHKLVEGKLVRVPVNLVGRFDTLKDRDGYLVNRANLQVKTAMLIGLGSVGSAVACDLARSGVGKFVIADKERLEWGNVVRHVAGLSDVGRFKCRIVSDFIKDRNPNAEVQEIPTELSSSSKDIYDQAFAAADVVICATDNRASRLISNRLAIKHQKQIIFGGLTVGAYAGMVFQCTPFESMCYHCFVSSFPEAAADRESNETAYSGGPDGHLALDIEPITNLMAKLALLELQKQLGDVSGGLDADLSAPWYLWVNRREGEYSELAPLGSPIKGPQILQWRPVPMDRLEDCPHCGGR